VKTARLPTLALLVWIGLLAQVPASAQQYMPSAPASEVSAPGAPSGAATDQALMFDNGLWEGADVGPCCSICGGGSGCPADWYTRQGVRILSRSTSRKAQISFQAPPSGLYSVYSPSEGTYKVMNVDTPTTGTASHRYNVLQTSQLPLDVSAGYSATIGHYFCRDRNNNDHFVEFTFWGLNSWSASKTAAGYLVPVYDESITYVSYPYSPTTTGETRGSLRTPFPTPGELPGMTADQETINQAFNYGIEHKMSYRSAMNNFEINGRFRPRGQPDRLVMHPDGKWRRECQPGTYMSYLYGLRFMDIDETFKLHSISQDNLVSHQTVNGVGDYNVLAYNNLLGVQIGAEMMFRRCRWEWGFEARLGPYINFASQTSTINAVVTGGGMDDTVSRRLADNQAKAALVGEVGVKASYKFRPNFVGHAAYDLMWISGLALAPEQLQFVANPVNQVNTNGMIFSQGVSFGLEWLW